MNEGENQKGRGSSGPSLDLEGLLNDSWNFDVKLGKDFEDLVAE